MPDHKDLLDILRQTDGYLSGEELSRQLGVTRAAVWKKIEQLRQEGYVTTDRRTGVMVRQREEGKPTVPEETLKGLRLRLCELRLAGLSREEILRLCEKLCDEEAR